MSTCRRSAQKLSIRSSFVALIALIAVLSVLTAMPRGAVAAIDGEEQAFLTLINSHRTANGLGTLTLDSQLNVVADWNSAYYGNFSRYGGTSSMVVSYASSPPAEVIFADKPLDEAPTGVIEAGCYRQVEYAGVLAGTGHPEAAEKLIDFMVSVEFQEAIPLTWFVFPANRNAALPQEFVDHAVIPENPARLSAAYIAENRDRWIDEWIQVMEG